MTVLGCQAIRSQGPLFVLQALRQVAGLTPPLIVEAFAPAPPPPSTVLVQEVTFGAKVSAPATSASPFLAPASIITAPLLGSM